MTAAPSAADGFALRSGPWSDPHEALDRAEMLVSSRVGVIRSLLCTELSPGSPDLHVYAAQFANPLALSQRRDTIGALDVWGSGASTDCVEAQAATIGEAIERYSLMLSGKQLEHRASKEVDASVCDRRTFELFSEKQLQAPRFPFVAHDPNMPIGWLPAWNLGEDKPALYPASLSFLSYEGNHDEGPFGYASSSGVASGCTREEALLGAITELVERDAVVLTWLQERSRPLIDLSGALPQRVAAIVEKIQEVGLDVHAIDITTDVGIPTVLAAASSSNPARPALSIGAACRLDPWRALQKALTEAAHTYGFLDNVTRGLDLGREIDEAFYAPEALSTFKDHAKLFAHHGMMEHAEFLLASDERADLSRYEAPPEGSRRAQPAAQIEECVARLGARGFPVYAMDMTPDDIAEADFSVVRAASPGLQTLWAKHWSFLGCRRTYASVDADSERVYQESDLNSIPHPFP
jgi:ribosomal protein S12 methylthiotransferase accessory factor